MINEFISTAATSAEHIHRSISISFLMFVSIPGINEKACHRRERGGGYMAMSSIPCKMHVSALKDVIVFKTFSL